MLMQYKKDYEKTVMGLLSLLPDFKNLKNLREEMQLYENNQEFKLYLYRRGQNPEGVIAVQENKDFQIIRYLSLAPGVDREKTMSEIMKELAHVDLHKKIGAVPEYSYLLTYLGADND